MLVSRTFRAVVLNARKQSAAGLIPDDASKLEVIKLPEARKEFVLLPRRWVVECSFAWLARFRRIARDYECTAQSLASYHWLAFVSIALTHASSLKVHDYL